MSDIRHISRWCPAAIFKNVLSQRLGDYAHILKWWKYIILFSLLWYRAGKKPRAWQGLGLAPGGPAPRTLPLESTVHVFTVRRYALHGICDRNSVCLSVRLSVTLVDCVHMVRPTIMISSPYGSPIIPVSEDITFIPKFEGDHPERGRSMRVGAWVRIGDFRPISRRISETVRDTTKITINH